MSSYPGKTCVIDIDLEGPEQVSEEARGGFPPPMLSSADQGWNPHPLSVFRGSFRPFGAARSREVQESTR